ncbi:MAG: HIT family protein [Candidatus Thermoplasmatota archaeon]|jgi:bis(5'-nucleosidyl)-tetraphosphatase/histidine triad (HIT) family protein|nr:HIT family protein [Candidatus Thermoplasmatota archaeon]
MQDPDCPFCIDVIQDKNAAIVYEDEHVMAFMDYAPVEDGHLLIVPKMHYTDINDIDEEDYLKVHKLAKKMSPVLLKALSADGLNIGQNNGHCANQVVMHYHLHLIPRWCTSSPPSVSKQGRFARRPLTWERKIVDRKELDALAKLIRENLP